MYKILLLLGIICLFSFTAEAQLSVPQAEAVYGGSINAISAIPVSPTNTRVFISTQSANSIFYADMSTKATGTVSFGSFKVMPGAGASDGFGGGITQLAAHKATGDLYFVSQMGALIKVNPLKNTATTIENNGVTAIRILNLSDSLSYAFLDDQTGMRYGTLDSTGNFSEGSSSPIKMNVPPGGPSKAVICASPSSRFLYFAILPMMGGASTTPSLYVTTDKYDSFSTSTTFSSLNMSPLASDSVWWSAFAIGNDGTLFFGGVSSFQRIIAYSKDGGNTWTLDSTHTSGMGGPNFTFSNTGSTYTVYFATIYASYDSSAGFSGWNRIGSAGLQTHPNDGSVCVDPLNDSVVYMTTDQGLGASVNGGSVIREIDNGISAVQVNGLVLDSAKMNGWVASKSGMWRVTNYSSSPVWSIPIYPNFDGSPYYSVAMINGNPNSIYVGNSRVYKTTDGGSTWMMVFDAQNPPYNFNQFTYPLNVRAIKVDPYDSNVVMAGYGFQNGESQGGVFYSTDNGANWSQLLCQSSIVGQDINAMSIVFTRENDSTVAYIGARYDSLITDSTKRGRSVYRAVWNGTSWSVRQDMISLYTSNHADIIASVYSLTSSSSGDTLYAAGSDGTGSEPEVYYKVLGGSDLWNALGSSGMSPAAAIPGPPSQVTAITWGKDTLYCAINNNIFTRAVTSDTSWSLGYSYPIGDAINVLYFDDLLVGTGTGLYGQHVTSATTGVKNHSTAPGKYALFQNYPDPFNPTTVISYQLPAVSDVTLKVYDILGREVATLVNEKQIAGEHVVKFDGTRLSSGVYFYRIEAGSFTQVKKMLLIK